MNTLDYYNDKAQEYFDRTVDADFEDVRSEFCRHLKPGGRVLDFGCGSGRDARAFAEMGFETEAIDGSEELCRLAGEFFGLEVRCLRFEDFCDLSKYDGIWACASILHLERNALADVFGRIWDALVPGGVFYTTFKYGDFEGERDGRYYTDFDESGMECFLESFPGFAIEKEWTTEDALKEGRSQKWLNIILRKK